MTEKNITWNNNSHLKLCTILFTRWWTTSSRPIQKKKKKYHSDYYW